MNTKIIRCIAFLLLPLTGLVSANDKWLIRCKTSCSSCAGSNQSCEIGSNTYSLEFGPFEITEAAANAMAGVLGDGCTAVLQETWENTSSGSLQDGPGITSLNYRREGLVVEGVGPDYVKTETVSETVDGVTSEVKKPIQFPTKHTTIFFTDIVKESEESDSEESDSEEIIGFQSTEYLNTQLSAPDADGLRSIPTGALPVSITIHRNPDGTADATSGKLDVISKQRHPQTGVWVVRTIRTIAPQDENVWTTEFYLGDPTETDALPIDPYRVVTMTRTSNDDGTETVLEKTEDRDSFGDLVTTSYLSVKYGFYKYGNPVKISETQYTGNGSDLTTDWTYYTDAADQVSYNKPATMRRSDGKWANYTYEGSLVTGILVTKTVSGWLDNPAPDIGTEPDESANCVVTVIEARNETGTYSREEKIKDVVVSKTWGERYKDNSGYYVDKSRVETGISTLTTIRTGYPDDESVPEADQGRVKSIQYPNGTIALYSHAMNGDNLVVTVDSGVGSLGGITDGTRTISTYTSTDTLIEETVSDIASGVVLSMKVAIAFDANGLPSRWAYDYNTEDYSETLNGCCGIESTRSRDGVVTTYTNDALKRPKTVTSQGVTTTYTYDTVEIDGTAFPSTKIVKSSGSLSQDLGTTVYDHAGNVIQRIMPDLDGDGNDEVTNISRNYATRTTTTTNPDGGTVVVVTHADGRTKSTTGTGVNPRYHSYSTHSEQGGGRVTATANSVGGPWHRNYQNLAGRILKATIYEQSEEGEGSELTLNTYGYDIVGRLSSTSDADGVTNLTAYNTKGEAYRQAIDLNQNGQIDSADRITETISDVVADLSIGDFSFGDAIRTRTIVYDLSNNPITTATSYRSPDGLTTRQDVLGVDTHSTSSRASYVDRSDGTWTDTDTAPDGTQTSTAYVNWLPETRSLHDTAGSVIESTTTGYDALRRPNSRTGSRTASVVEAATAYHATNGLVVSVTEDLASGTDRVTSFEYDSMGHRVKTTLPDGSASHASYWTTGSVKAAWGSQTNPTVRFYDSEGRMTHLRTFSSTDLALAPDENTTGYDETEWIYNDRGLLTRKEYADSNGTDYTYTGAGRLKTRRWARGNWTRYDYDNAGSLEKTNYFTTTTTKEAMLAATEGNDPQTPDVVVANDKLGRPDTITQDGQSVISYEYDPSTLVLDKETIQYDIDHDGTVDLTRVLDRSRDALGRNTGYQLKDETTVENKAIYGYDPTHGRLWTVKGGGNVSSPQTFTYHYTPNSSLIAKVAGPVHDAVNTWETTRDVLDAKNNVIGESAVSTFDYAVNVIGQRESVETGGTAFPASPDWSWDYDSLGQITSADSSVNTYDRAYGYDTTGSRIEARYGDTTLTGTPNYAANSLNQYTTVPANTEVPAYDDDGNATSYPFPAASGTNSSLVWDGENRLISTTVGATTSDYLYDSQSRRIARTTGGSTTLYLYDGWNCIAEYTDLILTKTRLWGLDLSGTLQGAGGVGGMLSESHVSGTQITTYHPTYDGNGNVSEYLGSSGQMAAHFEYDPFGNTVVDADTGSLFVFRFSTKPLDSETGLYYYGHRYYDPVTGRWPSRDPIEERGGANLYGFVENDGIDTWDVLGRQGGMPDPPDMPELPPSGDQDSPMVLPPRDDDGPIGTTVYSVSCSCTMTAYCQCEGEIAAPVVSSYGVVARPLDSPIFIDEGFELDGDPGADARQRVDEFESEVSMEALIEALEELVKKCPPPKKLVFDDVLPDCSCDRF
ncbi:MAG: RHS repeat domain-containing protein [Verrucomicrobiota bacterium JB025]|nr:RHS repeat-associated core domain-containing protein [Verrucomicrobiota bacterium JB025]